jgi:signal transduction histidine kinase
MLALLLLFTFAYFVANPYAGFRYDSTGQVVELFVAPDGSAGLQHGDQLLQVGPVPWPDFHADFRRTLFDHVRPGEVVNLLIDRDGQRLTIPWRFPGPTAHEILQRLNSEWFLAYGLWLAGSLALLSVRPKDSRWRLMAAFCYVTAVWVLVGGGVAPTHVWGTALLLQAAAWLSVPIYWHFHWVFPRPLRPAPRWLPGLLYAAAALVIALQWLGLLPARAYAYGLLLAVGGALLLVLLHVILRRADRPALRVLLGALLVALSPLFAVGVVEAAGLAHPYFAGGAALLALPFLPVGYILGLARGRMGGMELRRNRLLALYTFAVILGTLLVIVHALAVAAFQLPSSALSVGVTAGLLAALGTIYLYRPFQRLIERRWLGVPPAPSQLLETYAARIATRLSEASLVTVLRDEVLPALLVRQSALLRYGEAQGLSVLYQSGVEHGQMPAERDLPGLLDSAGRERPTPLDATRPAWVRLALPLRVDERLIGLWLLGHRDPDDAYARSEIPVLKALADQTAVALAHLAQAELLRAAYKADVDRMETERASLARELHDTVLGDLAVLKRLVGAAEPPPAFSESYNRLTANLRSLVTGLRPAMLDYGLGAALGSLVDSLLDRASAAPEIELAVPATEARYPPDLERHLYRIVQQACENALRHAQASVIKIHGRLTADTIDLTVEDNGLGFDAGPDLDLAALIARRHFGLAGMYERAALIGATLAIASSPGHGTRVGIRWTGSRASPMH